MALIVAINIVVLAALFLAERRWRDRVTRFEENVIASILAIITLVSFVQVILRYGFSTGWGGALEFTSILFAWLILFGMSYAVKINAHLGVDIVVRTMPRPLFRALAVFGALSGAVYAIVFLYSDWMQVFGAHARGGALDYWAKMYKVGIGLTDLRYPDWMQEALGTKERVQRWIAYLILPVGLSLFGYRCVEAAIDIIRGRRELVIAGHEAEDLVAENRVEAQE